MTRFTTINSPLPRGPIKLKAQPGQRVVANACRINPSAEHDIAMRTQKHRTGPSRLTVLDFNVSAIQVSDGLAAIWTFSAHRFKDLLRALR
jgi:hypothetical protein